MKLQRRLITAVSIATATTLTLAACSGGAQQGSSNEWSIPEDAPDAEITVLSILDLSADGAQDVVDAFNEDYPSITVDWRTVAFDDLNSAVDAQVSDGNGVPDVYWADQPRIASLAARGYTEDLTEQFEPFADSFDQATYDSGVYEGSLWAVPFSSSTQLLYYNKELLDAAGLDYPSPDIDDRMTWDTLIEAAIDAKDAGAQYGFSFGQPDTYYQLQPIIEQLGGESGISGEAGLDLNITSPEWVEAMQWYQDTFESGASPQGSLNNYADVDAAFGNGQIAYTVEGPWLYLELADSDFESWGVAPQPVFEDRTPITPTGSFSLAMNPSSEEKEAAAIFMHWMSVEDGFTDNLPAPELPATPSGQANYFERPAFDSEQGNDTAQISEYETTHTAVPRPSSVGYIEFETIIGQAFSDIRNGSDVAQALEKADDQIQSAWKKYEGMKDN